MTDRHSDSGNRELPSHKDVTDAPIVPSVDHEIHELGNIILAMQFCLRQLRGRQGTDELEGVIRTGLEICEQGMAAFRKVRKATNAREVNCRSTVQPAIELRARASQYQQRAAEYHAIADQSQNLKARASYRHLAGTYETMGRQLEDHVRWYGREDQDVT